MEYVGSRLHLVVFGSALWLSGVDGGSYTQEAGGGGKERWYVDAWVSGDGGKDDAVFSESEAKGIESERRNWVVRVGNLPRVEFRGLCLPFVGVAGVERAVN